MIYVGGTNRLTDLRGRNVQYFDGPLRLYFVNVYRVYGTCRMDLLRLV